MNSDQRSLQWQKRQLILALVVTCLLAVALATLAWLNHVRSLQTATRVYVPALWIDNVHGTNAMNLGEIDVQNADVQTSDGKPCRRYVFAVCSNSPDTFRVQLAYTTNIKFEYTLYPAREGSSVDKDKSISVTGSDGNTYQYSYSTELKGTANRDNNTRKVTYGEYGNVHPAAEPTYWVSGAQNLDPEKDGHAVRYENGTYARYFVLEVSWDSALKNNKETDMVYLMAQSGAQGETQESTVS